MSYFKELLSSDPKATLAVLVERVHRQTPTSHHFNHICMGSMALSIERLHKMLSRYSDDVPQAPPPSNIGSGQFLAFKVSHSSMTGHDVFQANYKLNLGGQPR